MAEIEFQQVNGPYIAYGAYLDTRDFGRKVVGYIYLDPSGKLGWFAMTFHDLYVYPTTSTDTEPVYSETQRYFDNVEEAKQHIIDVWATPIDD